MGGNTAVQFQHSSLVTQSSSSVVLVENTTSTNDASSSSVAKDPKKKKLKKKKQKKIKDGKVIKVFKPDGEINVYKKAIKVSEVMTEELMVCRSDSFYIGQKIPPLEQHDRLQPGHTYFLLPSHLFHSVLSFVTIASFTSSCKQHQADEHVVVDDSKMKAAFLKKAAASSCSPFDIQKTPSGTLRIRVSELFISQLMMDQASSKGDHLVNLDTSTTTLAADLLCTTPQLHKEYKQLVVGSRRGWKPKLEMIKETPPSKGGINKRKVKMLLSASINRMKTKLKSKKNKKVVGLAQISSTPKKKKRTMKKKKSKKSPVSPSASLKANRFYNSGYRIAEKKPADVVM